MVLIIFDDLVAGVAPILTDLFDFFAELSRSYNSSVDCTESIFPRLPAKTLPRGNTDPREISRHPPSGGARAIITEFEPAVTVA